MDNAPFTFNCGNIGSFTAFTGGGGGGGAVSNEQGVTGTYFVGNYGLGGRIDNYDNMTNNINEANYWCGGDGGGMRGENEDYGGSSGNYDENHNSIEDESGSYHLITNYTTTQSYGLLAGAGGGGGSGGMDDVYDGGDGADGMCIIIIQPKTLVPNNTSPPQGFTVVPQLSPDYSAIPIVYTGPYASS